MHGFNIKRLRMGAKLKSETSKSFEESLRELEEILEELENSQIPLEAMVKKYETAKKCLENCRAKLDAAEMKVKKLSQDGSVEEFALESE